jgi:predicted  nucleic acid-binding Zn-ribbon protein
MSDLQRLIDEGVKIHPTNDAESVEVVTDSSVRNLKDVITDIEEDLKVIKQDSGTQSVLDLNDLKTELSNAREGNLTLDDRLDNIDVEISNIQNSINTSQTSDDYGTF